ncbi:unnamed protein product [Anisakis simplex]|uniref:G_PROTEIN_RECEP_F1_2 domain-containing protein n=1 Tax=Anisakis simplex TaxID=6269 RepID=A0A0M3JV13_ANISI|nr:unnamed protein product [Anisakis simplex]
MQLSEEDLSLSYVDIIVGVFYIVYAALGIGLHLIEIIACSKLSHRFNGFRFIAHYSTADILLLFQYGIWDGIVILTKSEIITRQQRQIVNVFINFTWWSSSYLSIVVTLTRLLSIVIPLKFLRMRMLTSHYICIGTWAIALVQSYTVTLFPWYADIHYNAKGYGMTCNWSAYALSGTQMYYFAFNGFTILTNLLLYVAVMIALLNKTQRRHLNGESRSMGCASSNARKRKIFAVKSLSNMAASFYSDKVIKCSRSVELSLLLSCFVNWLIAVIGQIAINLISFDNRWREFIVMLTFMTQCWMNTIMRLFLSAVLLRKVKQILMGYFPKTQKPCVVQTDGFVRIWTSGIR